MLHRSILLLAPLLAAACSSVQTPGPLPTDPVPALWRPAVGLTSCAPRSQASFAVFVPKGRTTPSLSVAPPNRRVVTRPVHVVREEQLAIRVSASRPVE